MEYNKYKDLVKKYYKNDCRELNFQNRVIIPFLESILPEEYEVVDSSTIYKNWENYKDDVGNGVCREKFANKYTPDLLVIKEWKLFSENKNKPLIIIEVKRPTAKDRAHAIKEVKEYLEKADHVILTDSITWEFYEKQNDEKIPPIYLGKDKKMVCERDLTVERIVDWVEERVWEELQERIKALI